MAEGILWAWLNLRYFFRFYYMSRQIFKGTATLRWIFTFWLLLQTFIISVDLPYIPLFFKTTPSALRYIDLCLLNFEWIFGRGKFLLQMIFLLIVYVFGIVYGIILARQVRKRIRMTSSDCYFVALFNFGLTKFLTFPLYAHFAYILYELIYVHDGYTIASFIIGVCNLLCHYFFQFINSVFIEPCGFYFENALDIFETRYNLYLYFVRQIFVTFTAFSKVDDPGLFEYISLVIDLILFLILVKLRVSNAVYVSPVGTFLEIGPLLSYIVIMTIRVFAKQIQPYYLLCYGIITLFIYAIIQYIYSGSVRKQMIRVFLAYAKHLEETPKYIPGNLAAIIRQASLEIGTPELFDEFLQTITPSQIKIPHLIELARFYAAFPDRRRDALALIQGKFTHNPWDKFQLYLFKKTLKSLINNAKPSDVVNLDILHRNLLVTQHLYWKSKLEGRKFDAVLNAIKSCFYHNELVCEIGYLLTRFPFDGNIRIHYADILFVAFGEAKKSLFSKKKGMQLLENRLSGDDPVFKLFSQRNPRIVQKQEEYDQSESSKLANVNSSSDPSLERQTQTIRFHFDDESMVIDENTSYAAVLVQKSKKVFPTGIVLNTVVAIIASIFFFGFVYFYFSEGDKVCFDIEDGQLTLFDSYIRFMSSYLFTYSIQATGISFNYSNDEEVCTANLKELGRVLSNYLNYFSLSSSQILRINSEMYHFILNVSNDRQTDCGGLNFIMVNPENNTDLYFQIIANRTESIQNDVDLLVNAVKNLASSAYIVFIILLVVLVIFCISFFVLMWYMNRPLFKEEPQIIDFLASTERLSLMLLEMSVESWNMLHNIFPLPEDIKKQQNIRQGKLHKKQQEEKKKRLAARRQEEAKARIREKEKEKEEEPQSNHIDLNRASISVSFIGFNHMGLMKAISNMNVKKPAGQQVENQMADQSSPLSSNNEENIKNSQDLNKFKRSSFSMDVSLDTNDGEKSAISNESNPSHESTTLLSGQTSLNSTQNPGDRRSITLPSESEKPEIPENLPQSQSIISKTILEAQKTESKITKYVYFAVLIPAFIAIVCYIFYLWPMSIDEDYNNQLIRIISDNQSLVNPIFGVYKPILKAFMYPTNFTDYLPQIKAYADILSNTDSLISDAYKRERTRIPVTQPSNVQVCTNTKDCMDYFLSLNSLPTQTFMNMLLSSLINFTLEASEILQEYTYNLYIDGGIDFYEGWNTTYMMEHLNYTPLAPVSNGFSYLASTIIGWCMILWIMLLIDNRFNSALNSLAHFPHQYFDMLEDAKKQEKISIPDSNAIFVTSIVETGEIYSISDNVLDQLGRHPLEFIGCIFDKEFPITDKVTDESGDMNKYQVRTYSTDRRKIEYSYESITTGQLTHSVLIEDIKTAYDKKKDTEFLNSLTYYIPPKFAQAYCEDGQVDFTFRNSYFILLQLCSDIPIEKKQPFYMSMHNFSQKYPTIHVINSAGDIIKVLMEEAPDILLLLILKDIIHESKNTLYGVSCVRKDIELQLQMDNEPFIEAEFENTQNLYTVILTQQQKSIVTLIGWKSDVIDKYGESVHKLLNNTQCQQFSFSVLSDVLKKI